MTGRPSKATLADVLSAFSVEPDTGRATLERYLRDYPDYAEELIDLSYEISVPAASSAASKQDEEMIDQAWRRHIRAQHSVDLLANLTAPQLKDLALALEIPRQVLTAFRERSILVPSVPKAFLAKFAEKISADLDDLWVSLVSPPAASLARSYKADGRPAPPEQITFERALIDAGVPEDKRDRLLSTDD